MLDWFCCPRLASRRCDYRGRLLLWGLLLWYFVILKFVKLVLGDRTTKMGFFTVRVDGVRWACVLFLTLFFRTSVQGTLSRVTPGMRNNRVLFVLINLLLISWCIACINY